MIRALWAAALVAIFLGLHVVGMAAWERIESPCACAPTPAQPYLYPANMGINTASIQNSGP